MDTINRYRIEKLRRAVSVVLIDGRRLDGDVFLWDRTKLPSHPEEPIDLLNDDEPFFPFFRDEQDVLHVAAGDVNAGLHPRHDADADVDAGPRRGDRHDDRVDLRDRSVDARSPADG